MKQEVPMIIPRPRYVNRLLHVKDKSIIKIITGLRRCGKSTLLFDLYYKELLRLGVAADHIIGVSLEGIRNWQLRDPMELYHYIEARIHDNRKVYIFLDEIQMVPHFEDVVNGLQHDFNCDIYITGSNSEFLSSDVNTRFRGRGIEIKVLPLLFSEYYGHYGGDKRECFRQYMMYGGMPYLLQEENPVDKAAYLTMIADTVSLKDMEERYHIRNTDAFRGIVRLLASSIGSYVSPNKIARTLSGGEKEKITSKTVSTYLDYLCNAFLFYRARRYDIKGKEYLKTLQKYYMADIGLRNAILGFRQLEPTHSLENLVYLELVGRNYLVDIGKNENKEIDFLVRSPEDTYYIQVSYHITDSRTRERELSSFHKLDDGYKKIIITMDDDPYEQMERGYKKINVLDFLMNERALEEI